MIPVIETNRLILRPHSVADYPYACAMWADPIVTRFVGGKPSSPQQTWSRLLTYLGHWHLYGYGYWAIEEKTSGEFIGELGFADFKREISESMRNVPELGFALVSKVHGRRFGSEAVEATMRWGDQHLQSNRTVCLISPENVASMNIVEKAGYVPFQREMFSEKLVVFHERIR